MIAAKSLCKTPIPPGDKGRHPLVVGASEIVKIGQGTVAAAEYGGLRFWVMILANLHRENSKSPDSECQPVKLGKVAVIRLLSSKMAR